MVVAASRGGEEEEAKSERERPQKATPFSEFYLSLSNNLHQSTA